MNIHAPQSQEAIAECKILMRAGIHIVTAQRNGPVDGPVQDALTGMYMLTNTWEGANPDTMIAVKDCYAILHDSEMDCDRFEDLIQRAEAYYPDYISGGKLTAEEIPGKLFASVVLPRNFGFKAQTDICKLAPVVEVVKGVIKADSGPLCSKAIGAKQSNILHYLWKDYSPEVAMWFISEVQQITNRWLPIHGFSVGISDYFPKTRTAVDAKIKDAMDKVTQINQALGNTPEAEMEIREVLNSVMNVGLDVGKNGMMKGDRNGMTIMRNAGSKGSSVNMTQISCLVGQQNVSGARIPTLLSEKSRAMVHFEMGDNSPEARGFVPDSYIKGLKPAGSVAHSMSGRQGLVATGVKTSETGYIQKRIGKKVEDYIIANDGSVRDANGRIIQFLYGDDGMDAKKIYSVGLAYPYFVHVANRVGMMNADYVLDGGKGKKRKLTEEEMAYLAESIVAGGEVEMNPIIQQQSENMREDLVIQLKKVRIYEEKIPDLFSNIRNECEMSKAQQGDMIGNNAATSLGEPVTQMTLNLFHHAGVGGKDVSLGVPRFNEILNATRSDKQKKATCAVRFSNGCSVGYNNVFEESTIAGLLDDYEMKWRGEVEPPSSPVNIIKYEKYEEKWWRCLKVAWNEAQEESLGAWVLILKFDVAVLLNKNITLDTIAGALEEASEGRYVCLASPLCEGEVEVYCDFKKTGKDLIKGLAGADNFRNEENIDFFTCRDVLLTYVKKVKVTGVKGVIKTHLEQDNSGDLLTLSLAKITPIAAHKRFLDILTTDGVDPLRTICDDMHCIYATLGIEATRKFLMKEIERVIFFDGTYVNKRHIQILVDSMTHTGEITSVRRDGIPRDVGAIAKMLFEDSIPNAVQSAVFGEADKKTSISSAVMLGCVSKAGTGSVKVIRDKEVPANPILIKPGFVPQDEKKGPKKKKKNILTFKGDEIEI